jgi:hypothetical protein
MKKVQNGTLTVSKQMVASWQPAIEEFISKSVYAGLSKQRIALLTGIVHKEAQKIGLVDGEGNFALEGYGMMAVTGQNSSLAADILNPTTGGHNGHVATGGAKGSADPSYLLGICVAIAAKTIGLELVQTVPASSQNVTVNYLSIVYNGGNPENGDNTNVYLLTAVPTQSYKGFVAIKDYAFRLDGTYSNNGDEQTFILAKMRRVAREKQGAYIFEITGRITAKNTSNALTDIVYVANANLAQGFAGSTAFEIAADLSTITPITVSGSPVLIGSAENTKAVENFVPHQTTNGLNRTLTRSEADAGTDRMLELELENEAFVIGNRTITGHVSRLKYKQLVEQGVDALPYLTAAMKNEVSQEINWQIISAARAYGISNALRLQDQGISFNTLVAPSSVSSMAFDALPFATGLTDKNGDSVVGKFNAVQNLLATMNYETVASIGTMICMVIRNAAYAIGTESRYGDADAVIIPSHIAGFLSSSASFTKLSEHNVAIDSATGAKQVGDIDGIKVYVDVQMPAGAPYITVLRTNQDVTIDMPGITDQNVLVPGLAYIVKDIISSTELVPEGTGGKKVIMDSETELVAIGENPEAGYLTFAMELRVPGLK